MPEKILIVEDEMRIARWTQAYIEKAGYTCLWATNGRDALYMAHQEQPDLIVLDIMLPGIDGWTVCKNLREKSDVPIIMLTAKMAEDDIISGLKLGADDYITKPFNPNELVARIEANLRRAKGNMTPKNQLMSGSLMLELGTQQFFKNGQYVPLTAKQFELLEYFMRHPNQILSRDQIIDTVFGADYDSFSRAVDVHIRRLRTKIEDDASNPALIQTVFGMGYRFCPES